AGGFRQPDRLRFAPAARAGRDRHAGRAGGFASGPGAAARRDRGRACRLYLRSAGSRSPAGAPPAYSSAQTGAQAGCCRLTDTLTGIAARLRGLAGWRRLVAAFLLGAFSATAFAPVYFFPALLLGFAGLVILLDGADAAPHRFRAAAATGWAFAFGQFLIGMHWLVYPFMVDPTQHLWQLPFALTLLPAGLGLFGALACTAAALFWRAGAARLIMLALCWSVTEWLRGHVLTGFPWNLPAYGWGASLAVMQGASLVGAYGLSFLTVLFGVS